MPFFCAQIMPMKQFNIRVYGLLLHRNQLLVSDEYIAGRYITKLPGGGLEFGEGTIACLQREFREELNIDIQNIKHFYTTDFYQPSAFHPDHQIISIYYTCTSKSSSAVTTSNIVFNNPPIADSQAFRWIALEAISKETFTLPIDKVVADLIAENLNTLRSND